MSVQIKFTNGTTVSVKAVKNPDAVRGWSGEIFGLNNENKGEKMKDKARRARKELREAIRYGDDFFIIAVLVLALKEARKRK